MSGWRKNSSLISSFACAGRGFMMGLREERSLRLAVLLLLAAAIGGLWLSLPLAAYFLVLGAWGLLLAVELVNTGFERLADIIHPQFSSRIRAAKDLLAAAVLVLLLLAALVTLAVFVPAIAS